MKKSWSPSWLSSTQPRKQRKYRYNAPMHIRQKFVSANLSPELRKRFGKRSMQLRKGDEIKVMRGTFRGKTCVIERVDIPSCRVYAEEIKVKKVDGSEVARALQPSNVMITKLKLDDKKRQAILDRAGQGSQPRAAKPKPAVKKPEAPKAEKKAEKKAEPKKAKSTAKPAEKKPAPKPAKKPAAKKAPAKPTKAAAKKAVKKTAKPGAAKRK